MPSTPFFFFLGNVLFLAWFTTDVLSENVIDVLKGSSVVLSPDDAETSITSITWKHGGRFVAELLGEKSDFFFRCNDGCSLNTKTGELTINDVSPEHVGVYTPEINGQILSAQKLQVLYKVVNALKGSTVVLSPHLDKAEIISIKWKHGASLAADWIGRDVPFYRSFKDGCSLNTKTGELTINDVRPEHGGEYTPEINGQILSAIKLQVFSPVPKPRITPDCNPEQIKCILICSFDRTDDLGDVEVFWILDDRREKGTELHITKETKEETFICSLNNPVSSQNSIELKNPLFSGRKSFPAWIPVVLSAVLAVTLVALRVFCRGWTLPRDNDTQTLLDVHRMILETLKERNEIKLSEECKLMLLTVRSMILRILKEGTKVKKCLGNVKKMIKKFFKGRNETKQNEDGEQTLREVNQMISRFISEKGDKPAVSEEELSLLNEEMKLTLVKTSNATVEFESETGTGTDKELEDPNTDPPEEAIHEFGSPAGGDAVHPEETSLLETEECNQTSNVTVTVEINPQTESNTSKTQEPAESPAPSSDSKPDPDPETNEEAEDLNPDPPEEDNHETDSGSAENDLPEAERPEDSSGSPDGTVSTSETC